MKKKLIATLVAGAVLSTGLIGLTACGGDGLSINKGEEVSKEAWGTAIAASAAAKNYTLDAYQEVNFKITGDIEDLNITGLNASSLTKGEMKVYLDIDNGNYYSKTSVNVTVDGVPDELKEEDEFIAQEYSDESYTVKDGDTYYSASYRGSKENPEWEVYTSTSASGGGFEYLFTQTFATEENGTPATLTDLYDSFAYKDGVYSATLWQRGTEMTVSVAVKGGYVVGLSTEFTEEESDESSSMSSSMKMVYNFSAYGSTTVSASDAAKKAVEDYKAANN